jgi:hypothetical protein
MVEEEVAEHSFLPDGGPFETLQIGPRAHLHSWNAYMSNTDSEAKGLAPWHGSCKVDPRSSKLGFDVVVGFWYSQRTGRNPVIYNVVSLETHIGRLDLVFFGGLIGKRVRLEGGRRPQMQQWI